MKIDILAFGAHPDDVELSCAGTLIMHKRMGYKTGVVDLTRGELGTRGTVKQRDEEAQLAASIMELSIRENLGFADGFFTQDIEHQLAVIRVIRKYKPEIVLANAIYDRHPDHGRAAGLIEESLFKAGLKKIQTWDDQGDLHDPWRPKRLYHYIQSVSIQPDFLVDISDAIEDKFAAIRAYRTQFFDPESNEPDTYISSPLFLNMLEARSAELGHRIQVKHAEGFITKQITGVMDLFHLK